MSYNKETGMYEGYIYKIYNDINDKVYIGQTYTTIDYRWQKHKYESKNAEKTSAFHNALKRHGVSHFTPALVQKIESKTLSELIRMLDAQEIYYIDFYNSYYDGYNSTKGGRNNVDYQKRMVVKYSLYGEKMETYESVDSCKLEFESVRSIYDCCHGNCKYAYGHIWRYIEDCLEKFPLPNEQEKREAIVRYKSTCPIDKYDYKGNKILTYRNVQEASMFEHVSKRKIVKCCTGENVYCNLHIFRFFTDCFNTYKTFTDKPKLVEQYAKDGTFIAVYESTRAAARTIGISYQGIVAVCHEEQQTAGGYIWRYVENI